MEPAVADKEAAKKAAQATVALRKMLEEVERSVDELGAASSAEDRARVGEEMATIAGRVEKLAASRVVESTVQLKPHVMFLVNRVAACKDKLAKVGSSTRPASDAAAASGSDVVVLDADTPPPMPPRPESRNSVRIEEQNAASTSSPPLSSSAPAMAAVASEPVAPPQSDVPVTSSPPTLPRIELEPVAVAATPTRSPRIISMQAAPPAAAPWSPEGETASVEPAPPTLVGAAAEVVAADSTTPMRPAALRPAPLPPAVPAYSDGDTRRPTRNAPVPPPAGELDGAATSTRSSKRDFDSVVGLSARQTSPRVSTSTLPSARRLSGAVAGATPLPLSSSPPSTHGSLAPVLELSDGGGGALAPAAAPGAAGLTPMAVVTADRDWKAEHDRVASKFEAAKSLIMKLQEKIRRVEAAVTLMPALTRKLATLEARVGRLTAKNSYYEARVPQLNARIVALEMELSAERAAAAARRDAEGLAASDDSSASVPAPTTAAAAGERLWVKGADDELWYEATVVAVEPGAASLVVRMEQGGRETRTVPSSLVRSITLPGGGPAPPEFSGDDELDADDDPQLSSAAAAALVAAATAQQQQQQQQQQSPAPVAIAPQPIPVPSPAAHSAVTASRNLDNLLGSAKQNVKALFSGAGNRKKDALTGASTTLPAAAAPGGTAAGPPALTASTSSGALPSVTGAPTGGGSSGASAQAKLRALFKASPDRTSSRTTAALGSPAGAAQDEFLASDDIPADAVGLGEVQRIYSSDLWAAVMDPQSSDALLEVFFTTYEYHSTWEQVLGTLTAVYTESSGADADDVARRARCLLCLRRWLQLSPELLKAKATVGDPLKEYSFADPASLATGGASGADAESLAARGKSIVGDYSTARLTRETSSANMKAATTSSSAPSTPAAEQKRNGRSMTLMLKKPAPVSASPPSHGPGGVPAVSPRARGKTVLASNSSAAVTGSPPPSPRAERRLDGDGSDANSLHGVPVTNTGDSIADVSESELSDGGDDDEDGETVDVDVGDGDSNKTRKKGRALFRSIGSMYKSLKMDAQSLNRVFNKEGGGGEDADAPAPEDGIKRDARRLSFSSKPSFAEALRKWVEGGPLPGDTAIGEARDTFMAAYESWRRGTRQQKKAKSFTSRKLTRQDPSLKKRLMEEMRTASSVAIIQYPAAAVARQLFLEEWELFHSIKVEEFRRLRFMDATTGHNFQYMVHRFNTWCSWIATEVLNRATPAERAAVIEYFIDVGAECNKGHNFNSAYAIIGALNHPAVARLKFTWERVSKRSMRAYNKVLAFWSTSNNMAKYRAELRRVKPPAVPYLGLIGKDLFQVEMGTPTVLSLPEEEEWLLNFHKLRGLAVQFKALSTLQNSNAPSWEPNMDIATCISAVTPLSDDEAYERSLRLEPRGIASADQLPDSAAIGAGPAMLTDSKTDNSSEETTQTSGGPWSKGASVSGDLTMVSAAAAAAKAAVASDDGAKAAVAPPKATDAAAAPVSANALPTTTSAPLPIVNTVRARELADLRASSELEAFFMTVDAGTAPNLCAGHEILLASVAVALSRAPEFAPPAGKQRVSFTVAAAVLWLVRELELLRAAQKFDVVAAEAAKMRAVAVFEALRQGGLVEPAKKWSAKLATLRVGGFKGFSIKADDTAVYTVVAEQLELWGVESK